jgi:hypothetical protein
MRTQTVNSRPPGRIPSHFSSESDNLNVSAIGDAQITLKEVEEILLRPIVSLIPPVKELQMAHELGTRPQVWNGEHVP